MLIRSVHDVLGTDRDVSGPGWTSRRIAVAADGLGYSVHETLLDAGAELRFEYRNHRETVYCVEGDGTIQELGGPAVELRPGSLYSAGVGDDHTITARSAMKLVCIFTPPLLGTEEAD